MIPAVGIEASYADKDCSLRIKILEYSPYNNTEEFRFEVVKSLNKDSPCLYEEGDQFIRRRVRGDDRTWSLIFDEV